MPKQLLDSQKNCDTSLSQFYDNNFYENQVEEALCSARIYLAYLWRFIQPKIVLDVGCGRGAWLKACHELGSNNLIGLDGSWNHQSLMIDDSIQFKSIDLNQPFAIENKADLTISMEVAEHLEPATASQFIKSLTQSSDLVLFSAAYTKQGGTNHINEQPHTYWAKFFISESFFPFDLFRPVFWGNKEVAVWYRQNVFLYAKKNSSAWDLLTKNSLNAISELDFMNCVHPVLYDAKIAQAEAPGFRVHLYGLIPSLIRAIRRRAHF